ncbi:MAG: flavodoxin [Clostridiales bacterium]|nr:flavodoxin [Clostridiales bacterium]
MKNIFKTFICVLLGVILILTAVACNNNQGGENSLPSNYTRPSNPNIDNEFTATSKTLVAYFSKTNTTKGVAETIRELIDADIFEIERKEPYPNSYTPTTEVAKEEKNNNARPELATYLPDEIIAQYDTIILGFPIWWHTAPMVVGTFLETYDLSGKDIYSITQSASMSVEQFNQSFEFIKTCSAKDGRTRRTVKSLFDSVPRRNAFQ